MLSRKRNGFMGGQEMRENFDEMAKQLRIQRLKEVRAQEKQISEQRCRVYRDVIDERKDMKFQEKKRVKFEEMVTKVDQAVSELSQTLVETGTAHREAQSHSENLIKKQIKTENVTRQRSINAENRMNHAWLELKREQLERKRQDHEKFLLKQIRDQERYVEREDAHEFGEMKSAQKTRHEYITAERERIARTPQSAERVHHRFPIKITANVIRHGGSPGREEEEGLVINTAATAEVETKRNAWTNIMNEMKRKKVIKQRAAAARVSVLRSNTAEFLEEELKLLNNADRAGERIIRVKEAIGVPADVENAKVKSSFEKVFMSLPPPPPPVHYEGEEEEEARLTTTKKPSFPTTTLQQQQHQQQQQVSQKGDAFWIDMQRNKRSHSITSASTFSTAPSDDNSQSSYERRVQPTIPVTQPRAYLWSAEYNQTDSESSSPDSSAIQEEDGEEEEKEEEEEVEATNTKSEVEKSRQSRSSIRESKDLIQFDDSIIEGEEEEEEEEDGDHHPPPPTPPTAPAATSRATEGMVSVAGSFTIPRPETLQRLPSMSSLGASSSAGSEDIKRRDLEEDEGEDDDGDMDEDEDEEEKFPSLSSSSQREGEQQPPPQLKAPQSISDRDQSFTVSSSSPSPSPMWQPQRPPRSTEKASKSPRQAPRRDSEERQQRLSHRPSFTSASSPSMSGLAEQSSSDFSSTLPATAAAGRHEGDISGLNETTDSSFDLDQFMLPSPIPAPRQPASAARVSSSAAAAAVDDESSSSSLSASKGFAKALTEHIFSEISVADDEDEEEGNASISAQRQQQQRLVSHEQEHSTSDSSGELDRQLQRLQLSQQQGHRYLHSTYGMATLDESSGSFELDSLHRHDQHHQSSSLTSASASPVKRNITVEATARQERETAIRERLTAGTTMATNAPRPWEQNSSSDESSTLDLPSYKYGESGATLNEIQREIYEMRHRLLVAVSYPHGGTAVHEAADKVFASSATAAAAAAAAVDSSGMSSDDSLYMQMQQALRATQPLQHQQQLRQQQETKRSGEFFITEQSLSSDSTPRLHRETSFIANAPFVTSARGSYNYFANTNDSMGSSGGESSEESGSFLAMLQQPPVTTAATATTGVLSRKGSATSLSPPSRPLTTFMTELRASVESGSSELSNDEDRGLLQNRQQQQQVTTTTTTTTTTMQMTTERRQTEVTTTTTELQEQLLHDSDDSTPSLHVSVTAGQRFGATTFAGEQDDDEDDDEEDEGFEQDLQRAMQFLRDDGDAWEDDDDDEE